MARRSQIKSSPVKPVDEEDNSQYDEDEIGPESADDAEAERANGLTLHLGSDLPDPPPHVESSPASHGRHVGMGNEQSKEEHHARILQGVEGLRAAPTTMNTRQSTGRLVAPSTTASGQPAYRNPLLSVHAKQRHLGPVDKKRKSTYDVDADSPMKKTGMFDETTHFSPTRASRSNKALQEAREVASNPRRSTRLQEVEPEEDEDDIDPRYRDRFPDRVVRQHMGTGEEARDGNIDQNVGDIPAAPSPEKTKKKPGRPWKNSKAPSIEEPASSSGRSLRKSGRLSEAKGAGEEGDQITSSRQTRARASKSQSPQKKAPKPAKGKQNTRRSLQQRSNDSLAGDDSDEDDDQPDVESARKEGTKQDALVQFAADYESDDVDVPPSKRQKTRASASSGSRRKTKFHAEEPKETAPVDPNRLFGQWSRLKEVYKAKSYIGCNVEVEGKFRTRQEQNEIDLTDGQVRAAVQLCRKATRLYTKWQKSPGNLEHDPVNTLIEIEEYVDGLCGKNEAFHYDKTSVTRCTQIYYHLVPKLLTLIEQAVASYEIMDKDEVSEGQITIAHLTMVKDIIGVLLDLIAGAQLYNRPDTHAHVVEPVRTNIHPPLRAVHKAFRAHIDRHFYELAQIARREDAARQRALRLEQEERRDRENAVIKELQRKWRDLHFRRIQAEGPLPADKKRRHLQQPSSHIDIDEYGVEFERTQVFLPRVGPPPGLVAQAAQLVWYDDELKALAYGLRTYAGRFVLESVFWTFCQPGGKLNRFNVTEIVTAAASIREILISEAEAEGSEVEPWISEIPVWTKPHQALGKENEGEAVEGEDGRDEGERGGAANGAQEADTLFV